MSARAVSKYTRKLTGGVGAVFLRFLGPDDRRIIMFDSNDEWWHVEARRGHGPHVQQVGDALAAPRVASVVDERPPCWWIKKGVRTKKKNRSVRSGVRNRKYQSVASPEDHALDHTRPEGVVFVGSNTLE